MDIVNEKAIERLGDILDAIKFEADAITDGSYNFSEDKDASEIIVNLATAFDLIHRNVR